MTRDPQKVLENTIQRCRERNIIIPTYAQMADPQTIPEGIKQELGAIGLWDLHPRNLFRITWKNEPKTLGGGFGSLNTLEFPPELTGVPARIVMLLGKFFPTGSHKVGATIGPLVEKLVTGDFDPTHQKALWPSTGNYCRGGAYNARLLACPSIAVLPEGMSQERFAWLEKMGSEIHATPGSESNVKEVYDKSFALHKERPDEIVIFNQFEEFGNALWHYVCTGNAMQQICEQASSQGSRCAGLFLTQGSAGTLAAGDSLRENFPFIKVCAGEAWPCPTLLFNGFGEHHIEGIGDKHVPWIHNLKNMDLVAGIDDQRCLRLVRLFNETKGKEYLQTRGIPEECVEKLDLLGISGIANLVGAIKTAKYFEWTAADVVLTVSTDSMELYQSRLFELRKENGAYSEMQAGRDFEGGLMALSTDHMLEPSYWDKKRMHNLKYFTWVEQLGKEAAELDRQWYDDSYWKEKFNACAHWDEKIDEFNLRTGLINEYL
jgi:cysteine synthase A